MYRVLGALTAVGSVQWISDTCVTNGSWSSETVRSFSLDPYHDSLILVEISLRLVIRQSGVDRGFE